MEKDIGKLTKGEYQGTVTDIVIGIKEYNGRVGVDIREFTKSEQYTGPTKKGLRIPADSFEEFKDLINSINADDLKSEPSQEKLPDQSDPAPKEDSGIDESGLM
jgi:sporulation protein YlmC with PRC-barrel domain